MTDMVGFHRDLYVGLCRPAAPVAGPCFRLLFMQSSAQDWGYSFLIPLSKILLCLELLPGSQQGGLKPPHKPFKRSHYPVKRECRGET